MIALNVVIINGRLVGRTVSDRWNLQTLGYRPGRHSEDMLRNLASACGLVLRVHRKAGAQTIRADASKLERDALTPSLLRRFVQTGMRAMRA